MELSWKILDSKTSSHITNIIIRITHLIKNLHNKYPNDIIILNAATINQIFVNDDITKNIDMNKVNSMHFNWNANNPFPLNSSPEIIDFQHMWFNNKIKTDISWMKFCEICNTDKIILVCIDHNTLYIYSLILDDENVLKLHQSK